MRLKKESIFSNKTNLRASIPLLVMNIPSILYVILFSYIPIVGLWMAFTDFSYRDGIFGSKFVGLKNFEFFFASNDAWRIIRNTVFYSIWFFILNTIFAVLFAILFYEIASRRALKYFQSTITFPNMMSAVLVAYVVYSLLSQNGGIVNQILQLFGKDAVNFYNEPKYWFLILSIISVWMGIGTNTLLYYGVLMGIDTSLFEAAMMDGAGRVKQIWHVSLPALVPVICLQSIMSMGGALNSNFGLFYIIPMNSSALYPVTDVISTYLYRGLMDGSIGQTTAVGFFQSVCGTILLVLTNTIIRKVSPENSMY